MFSVWQMTAPRDSYEFIACGTGLLHMFRVHNGELLESRTLVVSTRAVGCDRQIAMYSVGEHAITRSMRLPGDEGAVWTLSYDCRLRSLFSGRAAPGGVADLFCRELFTALP